QARCSERGPVAPQTITFDDQSPGTIITTQYARLGVVFRGALIDKDLAARSGTRVLRAGNPSSEFNPDRLLIDFLSPQSRVSFCAGTTFCTTPQNGILRAYDTSGALVIQDGPKLVAPRSFTTTFEVRTNSPSIVHVEFEIPPVEFEAIDDLEVAG